MSEREVLDIITSLTILAKLLDSRYMSNTIASSDAVIGCNNFACLINIFKSSIKPKRF